jgi:hypothetical protein
VRNGDSDKALKFLEKRDKRYQPSMKIGWDKDNPVNIVSKQFFLPDNGRWQKKKKKSDPKSDFN